MRTEAPAWTRRLGTAVVCAAASLLLACTDQAPAPAGPEGSTPSFSHTDEDGSADATRTLSDNVSGDGSEVCNDSRVKDTEIVGTDEGTWSGRKVDPPEDLTDHGFVLDVKGQKTLDWTDDGENLLQAVLIKAGGSSVVYYYNEGDPGTGPDPVEDFSDDKLDGDGDKEISHYVYCFVEQPAVKRGVKFDDANGDGTRDDGEPALAGWEIRAYADDGDGTLGQSEFEAGAVATTTTADGSGRLDEGQYEFRLDPGDYVVCEVQRDGWNQSSLASDTDGACAAGDGLAADGYGVSLSAGDLDEGNDFANNQTTIEVTVRDPAGDPVAGQSVIAVHSTNGPYHDGTFGMAGTLRQGTTDSDGFTVIGGLEGGSYCVHTSPVAPTTDFRVPPKNATEPPAPASNRGTAVSGTAATGDDKSLTLSNFRKECLDDPEIEPGDEATLTVKVPDDDVKGTFETLDGDKGREISAWVVADLSGLSLPQEWIDNVPDTGVADRRLGLLVTGAKDEETTAFTVKNAPGGDVVFESDKVSVSGVLTSASLFTSGTDDVGTVAVEPLRCVTETVAEPKDDGGNVELKGPYDHGFLADKDLNLIEDAFGISYAQTAGEAKLKVRAKNKNTKRLVVDYTCEADGTCTIDKTTGGLAKRIEVKLGSAGGNRVRWLITGLPKGTQEIQSGVSAPNDQIPNAAKDKDDDGLVDATLPSSCVNDQPTWTIGG